MKNKISSQNAERQMVLLALEALQSSVVRPCPCDERLAAFAGGRLQGEERQAMLVHLNRCPHCYRDWTEGAAYLLDTVQPVDTRKPAYGPGPPPSLSQVWDWQDRRDGGLFKGS